MRTFSQLGSLENSVECLDRGGLLVLGRLGSLEVAYC